MHISDLHIERLTRREETIIQWAQALKPDLILLTGDYLNLSYVYDGRAHSELWRFLSRLAAPGGVYATLGSPPVDVRSVVPALFEGLPVRLLRDEWVDVALDDGRSITLLGVDCSHHVATDAGVLRELAAHAPMNAPRVLLYHSPELADALDGLNIDLYLCGHTHGGQVRLPGWGAVMTSSQLGKRFEMGRYEMNGTTLYVSRGIGLEGLSAPRVRFLSPPEITLFELFPDGRLPTDPPA